MTPNHLWKLIAVTTLVLTGLLGGAGAASGGVGKSKGKAKADKAAKAPQTETEPEAEREDARPKGRKAKRGVRIIGADGSVEEREGSEVTTTPGKATASGGEPQIVGRVIYGEAKAKAAIGVVDVKRVFDHIPSYQKIKQENLRKTKARYHFLISQANEQFKQAVELEAMTALIDVVVEDGGVENAGADVVDLTDKVIQRIERG